ncbi:MAG: SBBP repeat-containing protein, partial [Candidatus Thorarchaeota archaeon]
DPNIGLPESPNKIFKMLGGSENDVFVTSAIDSNQNIIVAGYTSSKNLQIKNGFQKAFGGGIYDSFIVKFDKYANILWLTYLGGSGNDIIWKLVIDRSDDSIYLTGWTSSQDFPLFQPIQQNFGGDWDVFTTQLSSNGNILFSTFIGGSAGDEGIDLAINIKGEIILTGNTFSQDFPILNAFQTHKEVNSSDAFLILLNKTNILFSTFIGGSLSDYAFTTTTDSIGNIYIGGTTYSSDFPVKGSYQNYLSGDNDGFIAEFSSKGSLEYSTYFGGQKSDLIRKITLNKGNNLIFAGYSSSSNFNVSNSNKYGSLLNNSAFIGIFNSNHSLDGLSRVGGSGDDQINSLTINSDNEFYLVGKTTSIDLPNLKSNFSKYSGGSTDGLLCKFSQKLELNYCQYYGGESEDQLLDITVDSTDFMILTGFSSSQSINDYACLHYGKYDGLLIIRGDIDDQDKDGIPMYWEKKYGLNPFNSNDSNLDFDNDSLNNIYEYKHGMDPVQAYDAYLDYNNNSLPTFWEVSMHLDPFGYSNENLDTDRDGLTNLQEYRFGLNATDPSDSLLDFDHDGINNIKEIQLKLDIDNRDTDGDGFSDGLEISVYSLFSDPLNRYDNLINRLVILIISFIVLINISFVTKSYLKTYYRQYNNKKAERNLNIQNSLSNILSQLKNININLDTLSSVVSDTISINELNILLKNLDSFIGPFRDIELQFNKFINFSKKSGINSIISNIEKEKSKYLNTMHNTRAKIINIVKLKDVNTTRPFLSEDEIFCFYCGSSVPLNALQCNYCLQKIESCPICKRNISYGDTASRCPECFHIFHYGHHAESVKIVGRCPICRVRIQVDELIPIESISK